MQISSENLRNETVMFAPTHAYRWLDTPDAMAFVGFPPHGWIVVLNLLVFLIPMVLDAYRFLRKEERIALSE